MSRATEQWAEWDYHRPQRVGCFQIVVLVLLIFLGWFLVLWLDSAYREAKALKPAAVIEAK